MIFNKKFETITFADIQQMVDEKYPENIILDYKREFNNKDAAKVVSSLANTYGGYIIFGIEEEESTNKPDFICGLEEDEKALESKLVNTTVDSIFPYVSCETKILYNDNRSLKIFVVKVPESDLSPHGVEQNTKWYIRVNDRKKLIDKPDWERLSWLKNRREKFVKFREQALSQIENRMQTAFNIQSRAHVFLETAIIPVYPREQIVSFHEFNQFLMKEMSAFNSFHKARFSYRDAKRVNDGIYMFADYGGIAYALEINCFGFCIVKTKMKKYGDPTPAYVQTGDLCVNLVTGMMLGVHILRAAGFRGSIISNSNLVGIHNSLIADEIPGYGRFKVFSQEICRGDDYVELQSTCTSQDYESHVRMHIEEFLAKFFYLYEINDDLRICSSKLFTEIAGDPNLGYSKLFGLN